MSPLHHLVEGHDLRITWKIVPVVVVPEEADECCEASRCLEPGILSLPRVTDRHRLGKRMQIHPRNITVLEQIVVITVGTRDVVGQQSARDITIPELTTVHLINRSGRDGGESIEEGLVMVGDQTPFSKGESELTRVGVTVDEQRVVKRFQILELRPEAEGDELPLLLGEGELEDLTSCDPIGAV